MTNSIQKKMQIIIIPDQIAQVNDPSSKQITYKG